MQALMMKKERKKRRKSCPVYANHATLSPVPLEAACDANTQLPPTAEFSEGRVTAQRVQTGSSDELLHAAFRPIDDVYQHDKYLLPALAEPVIIPFPLTFVKMENGVFEPWHQSLRLCYSAAHNPFWCPAMQRDSAATTRYCTTQLQNVLKEGKFTASVHFINSFPLKHFCQREPQSDDAVFRQQSKSSLFFF